MIDCYANQRAQKRASHLTHCTQDKSVMKNTAMKALDPCVGDLLFSGAEQAVRRKFLIYCDLRFCPCLKKRHGRELKKGVDRREVPGQQKGGATVGGNTHSSQG